MKWKQGMLSQSSPKTSLSSRRTFARPGPEEDSTEVAHSWPLTSPSALAGLQGPVLFMKREKEAAFLIYTLATRRERGKKGTPFYVQWLARFSEDIGRGGERKAIWKVKNDPPQWVTWPHFSLNIHTHRHIKKPIYESHITTLQFGKEEIK